jgi:hypothetical protein
LKLTTLLTTIAKIDSWLERPVLKRFSGGGTEMGQKTAASSVLSVD